MSFEINDPVVDVRYGLGYVSIVENNKVVCFFRDGDTMETYTLDGKLYEEDNPILFHAEGYVPPTGVKEPCRFKKGDLVLTSDKDSYLGWVNIFSHVDEVGNYRTFHSCTESGEDIVYSAWQRIKPFNVEDIETE